ncbi:response regulator [Lysinibacillus sp. G4S2]|uniref:response regulator n=1 Tax=Lysinibacillus sp. G4S2 TaxID=3055859 RepID=UPI0025A14066|nr:response regulator [Lysinibacillus sp. G4S2]MDM5247266.1 response regulator [Lysinibacillus sp. G4S2]
MKKRILIAEDEPIIRLDLKMMLQNHGYEVVGEAGDGDRAIELAFNLKPDLVLMDHAC